MTAIQDGAHRFVEMERISSICLAASRAYLIPAKSRACYNGIVSHLHLGTLVLSEITLAADHQDNVGSRDAAGVIRLAAHPPATLGLAQSTPHTHLRVGLGVVNPAQ